MVELVDDHHLELIWLQPSHAGAGERLNAGEDVPPLCRFLPVDVQLSECAVGKHFAVRAQGLLEDLLAMRHKQQGQPLTSLIAEAAVVEGSNHRLPVPVAATSK